MMEKLSMQTVTETAAVLGKYEEPVVCVTHFTSADVITASYENGEDYSNGDWE